MNLQAIVDFRVIDESLDWIVVEKPAPLIVHPTNQGDEPTLLGGLEQLLAYERSNGAVPGIVTRLDRETSGIVLVAKHRDAARELGGIFERREAIKEYLAAVHGWPEKEEWTVDEPILRAGEVMRSRIWVKQIVHPQGKDCLTHFRVEKRFLRGGSRFSLIRCFPQTGRMHQIRVHLTHSGSPIVGDKIYSRDGDEYLEWMEFGMTQDLQRRLLLARHALHAAKLSIPGPEGQHSWECELPRDMADFVAGNEITPTEEIVNWERRA